VLVELHAATASAEISRSYVRRTPERGVLHRVVREHLQTFPQSTYRWVSRGSTMDVHEAPIPLFSPTTRISVHGRVHSIDNSRSIEGEELKP